MIKRIKNSLTAKLFLITMLLLALVCALTYGSIALFMPLSYSYQISGDMESRTQRLIADLTNVTLAESGPLLEAYIRETGSGLTFRNGDGDTVKTPVGTTIYYYDDGDGVSLAADFPIEGRTPSGFGIESTADVTEAVNYGTKVSVIGDGGDEATVVREYALSGDVINLNYPVKFAGDENTYDLTVTYTNQPVNQAVEALYKIMPWLILAVLGISVAGSLIYSRYVTRPIIKISRLSKKMSELEFDWRCDEGRQDEIGVLAHSLNQLSESLDRTLQELHESNAALKSDIERERQLEQNRMAFFAAVSHELKTPITVIKGQIEGMLGNVGAYSDRDKYLNRALCVTGTMEDIVQDILAISRIESSGFELKKSGVDIGLLVRDALATHGELLEQRGLRLTADIADGLFVSAEKALLAKVISNLISNAAFYSPVGEQVFVKAYEAGGRVVFEIENTGVSIPEGELKKLFGAFYRVEKSRNRKTGGTGLGLYFVKMILEMHGADYAIRNTAGGVEFTFEMEKC